MWVVELVVLVVSLRGAGVVMVELVVLAVVVVLLLVIKLQVCFALLAVFLLV